MLGNVEEFVLEPFYMNRIGRRHGQPGGFVAKGGSFQDPADRLRTAMRREYGMFDQQTGKALALDSFGFRLVLAAPVELSLEEATRLREEWLAARGRRVELGDDPLAAVARARRGGHRFRAQGAPARRSRSCSAPSCPSATTSRTARCARRC